MEEAEKSTGVPQGEINRCIVGDIWTAGGFVLRWTGKKKDRLSQFEHAATYNNLLDAENSTGVHHSNISAVLKGKGNTMGGLVWVRVNGEKVSSDKSATPIDVAHKKECKDNKTDSSSDKVLVAYHLTKLEELDFTKGPIGIFKTQSEAADFFKIPKTSLFKYLKGVKDKLRWKINKDEKYWIGVRWETSSYNSSEELSDAITPSENERDSVTIDGEITVSGANKKEIMSEIKSKRKKKTTCYGPWHKDCLQSIRWIAV